MNPSDIKQIAELKIYRQGKFAGVLRRTKHGCELKLNDEFVRGAHFNELSYRIPKTTDLISQTGVNLLPFFAGLLPEGLRFKALVKKLKTSEDDLFSLLAATGASCIGDIYAIVEGLTRPDVKIPSVNEISFSDYFESTLALPPGHKRAEGFAGVQEKISAAMISFPVNVAKAKKTYILKLNPKDKPNLVHNEFQCVKLANHCDIEVNNVKIVYDKNKSSGLLVERFDRQFVNDDLQMVHQEDACQFLNRFPADKYRISMREIADGIGEFATAPLVDNLRLLQLYAFSYLIGNGDLHAKNISLQTESKSGRIKLTPVYDVICTYIYGDQSMALKLDGRDKNFKRVHVVDFGKRLGLSHEAIESMLNKLLTKFKHYHETLLEIEGLSAKEISGLKKMMSTRLKDLS